ncbi:MAG TPA: very short patch repair endonuclease [Clostridiales bacterium]|nr:very short patch repair endonuclease [Clostridiales bacterium]
MADIKTSEERSKNMSKIKGRNTRIEMIVRKRLFSMGFRYRINVSSLPGKPDIVLKKYMGAVFVNGCFWHGHDCKDGHLPKSNIEFWESKIKKNIERDKLNYALLEELGWNVITVWECELKDLDGTIDRVISRLVTGCSTRVAR